jgi:hypothetical protein
MTHSLIADSSQLTSTSDLTNRHRNFLHLIVLIGSREEFFQHPLNLEIIYYRNSWYGSFFPQKYFLTTKYMYVIKSWLCQEISSCVLYKKMQLNIKYTSFKMIEDRGTVAFCFTIRTVKN